MTKTTKEHYIPFVADNVYFRRLNELAGKLGVNRSECIRLMLDLGFKEYLDQKGPLLIVNDKEWDKMMEARISDVKFNKLVEKGLSSFLKNFGAFTTSPKLMAEFTEFIKVVTSKVAPKGAVQADAIEITETDVGKWIDECVKNDATFETRDVSPEVERVKKAILTTVRRLKGRID